MSVATVPSPFTRAKRLFEDEHSFLAEGASGHPFSSASAAKRTRVHRSPSAAARCGLQTPGSEGPAYAAGAVSQSTITALRSLFPEMSDETVSTVLAECGSNIDAAIKRLTELRLSSSEAVAAAAAAAASAAGEAAAPSTPGGPTAAPHSPGPTPSTPAPPTPVDPGLPQTADQWVDYLVSEMAAARDMTDARGRATNVLKNFERFVKAQSKQESDARLGELTGQNTVLKKAVQIQAARLQERAAMEQEIGALRHALAQYQDQVRTLEVNNYSLSLHLQKATNNSLLPHQRNPDVF